MRIFVLALAILLLPLRGWIGDAMALGVAQQQLHRQHAVADMAVEAAAHRRHASGGQAVAEHAAHHHAPQADAAPHAAPQQAPNDCQSTCGNCQLCHTVALTLLPDVPMLANAPREAPVHQDASFASAERAQGFKPPIS